MSDLTEKLTIPFLFNQTLNRVPDNPALGFAGEEAISYRELDKKINALISFLEGNGVKPGDRVAIFSLNMPNWGVAYYAITFMGAVVVPVLPDFSQTEVSNVISHSGTSVLFVSQSLLQKTENLEAEDLRLKVLIDDFTFTGNTEGPVKFDPDAVPSGKHEVKEDDLVSIIYTSGTTGRSKGVMLSQRNISFTALKGRVIQPLDETDRFLSVLPLSHTYENTLGLILPMLSGSSVYYLKKPPTPSVLLPALEEVKPTAMLTVPLIIEKIYYNKILPAFTDKFLMRMLYSIPFLRKILNKAAGKKLMKTFGGHLKFFGVGGAKLNKTVEKFLAEARFPYAIGYGLTETSPLLAGSNPAFTVPESTGPALEGVELKIHNPDRVTGEGEIWAKGPNVMIGYYKDPEMTAEVITPDGWFRTGDLGVFDKRNNLFIRGRLKNMIVGASGENIYPEEIESVINNFRHVVESLVIEQKGKLVALVHINMEEIEKKYIHLKAEASRQFDEKVEEILKEVQDYVNSRVNKFSQINKVVLQPVPFQKTATQKIKRFLYT
ncbi:MAG: AMP-binding protein [Bacteroidales bacterium]